MRLTDMVILLFVVGILSLTGINCFHSIQKCEKEIIACRKKTEAEYFIAESFRKTCYGEGFENLNKWQVVCRAMWNLEYIGWCEASDFMVVDYSINDRKLMYGKWNGKDFSGEVYCRRY